MDFTLDCLQPTVLAELLEGGIEEPALGELTRHLESCQACQAAAKTLELNSRYTETLRGDGAEADRASDPTPAVLIDRIKLIPQLDSGGGFERTFDAEEFAAHQLDEIRRALEPAQQVDEIGRLGHYRILEVLGRGGMGAVFLAEDPKLDRRIAFKMMLPKIASIRAARDRFLREAKAAARLKNDHIVTIYQVDEINGVPFLAMELLEGESLEQSLQAGRGFSAAETICIARDIALGLADAHEKGLIHRDIKPGNLWLERTPDDGRRIKILDFGLARAAVDDVKITEYGLIVGTPAFMAPEQARADRPIDGRADLFSLGAVMYLLCTGEIPFKADTTIGTLMALALVTPREPSHCNESVPLELSKFVMQLLEKDPNIRPQSAREVIERLTEIERSLASGVGNTIISRRALAHGSQPDASANRRMERTQPLRSAIGRGLKVATAFLIAGSLLVAAGIFFWQTPDGRIVRIECNDPSIKLAFQGRELKVTGAYDQPMTLAAGKVDLKITKPQPDGKDFEFETDKLVVRKGDEIALRIEVIDDEVQLRQEGLGLLDSKLLRTTSEQFQDLVAALRRVNPQFDGSVAPTFNARTITDLVIKTNFLTDIGPLRDLKNLKTLVLDGTYSPSSGVADLSPLQGLALRGLRLNGNMRIRDLSPLQGMPLTELYLDGTSVSDLSPLAGMPLRRLTLWGWRGSDLSPLKGLPIMHLNVGGNELPMDLSPLSQSPLEFLCLNLSRVSNIAPLKGLPLKDFYCENTLVSDLSPLQGAKLEEFIGGGSPIEDFSALRAMPLNWIKYDIVPERDLEMLREIKTLVRINNQRSSDFLREFSSDVKDAAVPAAFTNSIRMEFAHVPKGKAWLVRRETDERPMQKYETVFEQDFYLGTYEVMQEEWFKVMGANPSAFTRNGDGANEVKVLPDDILKRLPVEQVSWLDCQQFLKRLNEMDQQSGWTYRLPTEAEWQYACCGGTMKDASEAEFDFYAPSPGRELSADQANFAHELGWKRPCRVGLFPPNKLGLYDMIGNVGEWCDDRAKWQSTLRLLHAGSWSDPADGCRTSRIEAPAAPWSCYNLGLRVARVPVKN